jgi:hypothetical protein
VSAAHAGTTIGTAVAGLPTIDAALAGGLDPVPAAVLSLGLAGMLVVLILVWLRYRSTLRTRRRIVARLARIGATTTAQDGDTAAP